MATLLLGLVHTTLVSQNVVFQKVNEVTTTQARWLVTFVTDLTPYMEGITRLSEDVGNTASIAEEVLGYYRAKGREYVGSFKRLKLDIQMVEESLIGLKQDFDEYHSLYTKTGRDKRSLVPLIGKALGFLFGTVTESDLRSVQNNVATLAQNQQEVVHVVKQSLTLVNESRIRIAENRQTINSLIEALTRTDSRLRNVSEHLARKIYELESFMRHYVEIDTIIADVREVITRMTIYVEHLQLQLNMLALGRLTPSTITPSTLRQLLLDIREKLNPPLTLTGDPRTELWKFYKHLTCTTMFMDNKILVIVPVPLLDMQEDFEVYQVHNLPLPNKKVSHWEYQ